jgi:hypothetical protein
MAHTNAQIRHLFAQQNPESDASSGGKNGEGTFWFVGNRLYSYQTPIAKWHRISRGRSVVLITSDGYSVATKTKQLSGLSDALMPNMYLRVPYIGENGGKAPSAYSAQEMHEGNLKYLVERYEEAKARQARNRGEPSISEMADTADTVSKYCDWFDLKAPRLSVDVDFIEIKRAWENRNTPEMKARRKAEKEKRDGERAKADEQRRRELAEVADEWRRGERTHFSSSTMWPVMFRMKGDDTVQTSLGAEVPLKHAVRVFQFVKWVRMSGTRWQKNGHRVPVGHFQVDEIEPNGDFRAGCHNVTWAEIERFAREIGVYEEAASTAAEIHTAE